MAYLLGGSRVANFPVCGYVIKHALRSAQLAGGCIASDGTGVEAKGASIGLRRVANLLQCGQAVDSPYALIGRRPLLGSWAGSAK